MLDDAIKTKLRDPTYLDLHLAAVRSLNRVGPTSWYDAHFLRRYEVARDYLAVVNPGALATFERGFDPLKPPPGFDVSVLQNLFDDDTCAQIKAISRSIKAGHQDLSLKSQWEREYFGRQVVWDHPYFLELQRDLLGAASEAAGCTLRTGYNFLSLYGSGGLCDPHMDEPMSMFTLDYCIEQSDEWPIHFSQVVDWPTVETFRQFDPVAVKDDPGLDFRAFILQPNQALLFNGSSQWHYRNNIPTGGFCDLLFFHYYPAGCDDLVEPKRWASHFTSIPELGALCDLFERERRPGEG